MAGKDDSVVFREEQQR